MVIQFLVLEIPEISGIGIHCFGLLVGFVEVQTSKKNVVQQALKRLDYSRKSLDFLRIHVHFLDLRADKHGCSVSGHHRLDFEILVFLGRI